MAKETAEKPKTFTKQEVKAFLADVSEQIESSQGNYLHSILALNEVVRQPNAEKLFDQTMKRQAVEIWTKIKSAGLELNDPPFLFGYQGSEEA
jgi:hypothetical protein